MIAHRPFVCFIVFAPDLHSVLFDQEQILEKNFKVDVLYVACFELVRSRLPDLYHIVCLEEFSCSV